MPALQADRRLQHQVGAADPAGPPAQGANEGDRAKFAKLRDYVLRVDDEVTCKACNKRFEIPSMNSLVFVDQLVGLPEDAALEREIATATGEETPAAPPKPALPSRFTRKPTGWKYVPLPFSLRSTPGLAVFAIATLIAGLALAVELGAWDVENDEAIYTYAVERMIDTGDWMTPREIPNDCAFLEKPPLKFWLVGLPIRLGCCRAPRSGSAPSTPCSARSPSATSRCSATGWPGRPRRSPRASSCSACATWCCCTASAATTWRRRWSPPTPAGCITSCAGGTTARAATRSSPAPGSRSPS